MTIVVTGATGHLGKSIVEHLVARGVAPADIVAGGRSTEKLQALADSGVRTAVIDYIRPDTLTEALTDADTLILVSGSEVGQRVEQHRNAIDAAVAAGVKHLVYTSAPKADTSELVLAPEHKATEELIRASGIPATILRNGWYTENYVGALQQADATGVLLTSAGGGLVSSASRTDYAEAAAVVVAEDGHAGSVYELSGDVAWNQQQLADTFAEILGKPVELKSVSSEEHLAILKDAGLDEGTAGFVVALDANTRDGLLGETSGDLSRLIGHPTTPLIDGLRAAL
ncbi:SDR family oxidoreductase [Okibacterium fritillariae]|uniref:NAD(P)H dehydrogenase (Quinone) n=1 Tax=Okibacterium fritillariae TaxID=123320 RepID=A0A1T5IJ39_9MICO|nr:SDR family oxidoreductase [Okibacterium fritillariae]SKC39048.1 NAD(P)H dehydrogenase (quinone) [Okibacterium fritillariae]